MHSTKLVTIKQQIAGKESDTASKDGGDQKQS